jgi:hypothetical protein
MTQRILQRLIWKDARTLKALAIATPVAIVGFYLLIGVFTALSGAGAVEQISLAYAIWFLLPILLAYGAPAVLVGGEEESGSLAWLQTLPAGWRSIATSKLLVASACLLLAWGVGTLCLMSYWAALRPSDVDGIREGRGLPEPFWIHFAGAVALSFAVMLSSFTTAYWIRSPITALLAVVPLMIAVVYGVFYLVFLAIPGEQRHMPIELSDRMLVGFIALIVLSAIGLLLGLSFLAAWRRLTRPASGRVGEGGASDAFRPPRADAASMSSRTSLAGRPGKWGALLWQQFTPVRWHLIGLVMAAIAGVLLTMTESNFFAPLGCLIGFLACFSIASLTFYSDSVRQRSVFLSDRGISPTLVWLTRVGPTLLATLAVFAVAAVVLAHHYGVHWDGVAAFRWDQRVANWFAVGVASYALTQLASQWSPRPTLAFFAGPVFVHFAAFALAGLFLFFPNASPVLFVSAAVLLFASWQLMPQWMAGDTGRGYLGPFLGYITLAVVLPYILVLGARSITTPTEDTAWRNQLLEMTLPEAGPGADQVAILNPAFVRRIETLATAPVVEIDGRGERVAKELAETDAIGEQIAFKELLQIVMPAREYGLSYHQDQAANNVAVYQTPLVLSDTEQTRDARRLQFDALRVLLKWSRLTRQQAVVGNATFDVLFGVAENADLIAARVLKAYVDQQGMTPELRELVEQMPGVDLVRRSREISLIRNWKRYETGGGKFAGAYPGPPSQWWLAVERKRSARFIDKLAKTLVDRWSSDQTGWTPEELEEISALAREAYLSDASVGSAYYQNAELTEQLKKTDETDRLTTELRRKLAAAGE